MFVNEMKNRDYGELDAVSFIAGAEALEINEGIVFIVNESDPTVIISSCLNKKGFL